MLGLGGQNTQQAQQSFMGPYGDRRQYPNPLPGADI